MEVTVQEQQAELDEAAASSGLPVVPPFSPSLLPAFAPESADNDGAALAEEMGPATPEKPLDLTEKGMGPGGRGEGEDAAVDGKASGDPASEGDSGGELPEEKPDSNTALPSSSKENSVTSSPQTNNEMSEPASSLPAAASSSQGGKAHSSTNPLPLAVSEAKVKYRRASLSFVASSERTGVCIREAARRTVDSCSNGYDCARNRCICPFVKGAVSEATEPFFITCSTLTVCFGALISLLTLASLATFRAVFIAVSTPQGALLPSFLQLRQYWEEVGNGQFKRLFKFQSAFPSAPPSAGMPAVQEVSASSLLKLGYSLQASLSLPGVVGASWTTNDTATLLEGLGPSSPFVVGGGGVRPVVGVAPFPAVAEPAANPAPLDGATTTSASFLAGVMNVSFSDSIPWAGRRIDGLFSLVLRDPTFPVESSSSVFFNVSLALPLAFTAEYAQDRSAPPGSSAKDRCPYGTENEESKTCLTFFRLRSLCLVVSESPNNARATAFGLPSFNLARTGQGSDESSLVPSSLSVSGCAPLPRIPYLSPEEARFISPPQLDACFPTAGNGMGFGDYAPASDLEEADGFLSLGSSAPGTQFLPALSNGTATIVDFSRIVSTAPWPYPSLPWGGGPAPALLPSTVPPPGLFPVILRSSSDPYAYSASATSANGNGFSGANVVPSAARSKSGGPLASMTAFLLPLFSGYSGAAAASTLGGEPVLLPAWGLVGGLWAGFFSLLLLVLFACCAVPTMKAFQEKQEDGGPLSTRDCLLYSRKRARALRSVSAAARADVLRLVERYRQGAEPSALPFSMVSRAQVLCTYFFCCFWLPGAGRRAGSVSGGSCCYYYYRLACCLSPFWLSTLPKLWCSLYWSALLLTLPSCPCCRAVAPKNPTALTTMKANRRETARKKKKDASRKLRQQWESSGVLAAATNGMGQQLAKGGDGGEVAEHDETAGAEEGSLTLRISPPLSDVGVTSRGQQWRDERAGAPAKSSGAGCGAEGCSRSAPACCALSAVAWLGSIIVGGFALSLGPSPGHWTAEKRFCPSPSNGFDEDAGLASLETPTGYSSPSSSLPSEITYTPIFSAGLHFMAFGAAARISEGTVGFLWSPSTANELGAPSPVPLTTVPVPVSNSEPLGSPLLFPAGATLYSRFQLSAFLLCFAGPPLFVVFCIVGMFLRFGSRSVWRLTQGVCCGPRDTGRCRHYCSDDGRPVNCWTAARLGCEDIWLERGDCDLPCAARKGLGTDDSSASFLQSFLVVCLVVSLAASSCYFFSLFQLSRSSVAIAQAVCTFTSVVVAGSSLLPDRCSPTSSVTVLLPLAAALCVVHFGFLLVAVILSSQGRRRPAGERLEAAGGTEKSFKQSDLPSALKDTLRRMKRQATARAEAESQRLLAGPGPPGSFKVRPDENADDLEDGDARHEAEAAKHAFFSIRRSALSSRHHRVVSFHQDRRRQPARLTAMPPDSSHELQGFSSVTQAAAKAATLTARMMQRGGGEGDQPASSGRVTSSPFSLMRAVGDSVMLAVPPGLIHPGAASSTGAAPGRRQERR